MSCELPRVSPQTAHAKPSVRTDSASDCAFAGAGLTTTDADQVPAAGRRAARTCVGTVRASSHNAVRLPAPSTPIRALVCAAVPGSSEILTLAAQAAPPEISEL